MKCLHFFLKVSVSLTQTPFLICTFQFGSTETEKSMQRDTQSQRADVPVVL